jgi:hypothetical protein
LIHRLTALPANSRGSRVGTATVVVSHPSQQYLPATLLWQAAGKVCTGQESKHLRG